MRQFPYQFKSNIFSILLAVIFVQFVDKVAGGSPWCNSSAICVNSTHFNLCVGYENGYIYRWYLPMSCPTNSVCKSSRCEEQSPAPPYIFENKICNAYGFMCDGQQKFRLCKYNSYNNSVSFSWDYTCPQRTVCDGNYPYHCRDSSYSIPNLPPPVPPAPGFHVETPPPPVAPVVPTLPKVTRDDCNGKDFVCVDSKTYLLCRNMGDGTIRTYPEQFKCPKRGICHKTFDRPCAGSGAGSYYSYSGFGWGILALVLVVQIV